MHGIGILLLTVLYLGAGGTLGSALFDFTHGRGSEVLHQRGILAFTVVANLALLPCLYGLWRRRLPSQTLAARKLQLYSINRIGFLLFTAAWTIGLIAALLFGF